MHKAVFLTACCILLGSVAGAQAVKTSWHPIQPETTYFKTMGDFNLHSHYRVEINGRPVVGARSLTDLNALHQQLRSGYQDGEDGVSRTRPGKHMPGKLVLTKDWSNTLEWYTWRKAVIDGKTDRRSISIIFHDDAGTEVGRMNFYNCWPVKHVMPEMNAKSSGHASETMELNYDSVDWRGK